MIVKEFYKRRSDGVDLYITKSTEDFMIRKVGTDEIYTVAIDIDGAPYVYEETEIKNNEEGDRNVEQENINQNDRVRSNAGGRIISS